ncbi:MAG: hypothetical protein HYT61_03900 [Candidatus Yanofskybacteria bacterium]|nr:hypothetical protein [Candidatus Yanofskybacteria bacterium]
MKSELSKKHLTWIAVVLVLGAALFYFKVDLSRNAMNAQLSINFPDGQSRKFEGPVVTDMTVLEALYSSFLGDNFELKYSMREDNSVVLAKIGDAVKFGNHDWHFYLNGKPVKTSDINKIRIKAGDFIEVDYE